MEKIFDFGIIGGGPAGYTAALRAVELGKTAVIFEKENIGGVCLNKGCIPTKTFLHASDAFRSIKKLADFGISVENPTLDFQKLFEKKEKVIKILRNSLEKYLKSKGIDIIYDEAKIISNNDLIKIEAGNEEYECVNCIDARGSKPKGGGGFLYDNKFIVSSDDVLR